MWDPNSAASNFNLSIQFNKQVSADGYARARDQVLLTPGVQVKFEDAAERTMATNYTETLSSTIKAIPGVESANKVRVSGFGDSGGCFGPRGRRGW